MVALINLLHDSILDFKWKKMRLGEVKIDGLYDHKCIHAIFQELN